MFFLLICLCLFCALQSRVSSDQVVSLRCNNTVNATTGENLTLNCVVHWPDNQMCKGDHYVWSNTNGDELCDRVKEYSCESDLLNYVSLTILNIKKEENITVEIHSNCGMDKSAPIRVQVHGETTAQPIMNFNDAIKQNTPPQPSVPVEEWSPVPTILSCVSACVVAVVVIVFILYGKYKHRVKNWIWPEFCGCSVHGEYV